MDARIRPPPAAATRTGHLLWSRREALPAAGATGRAAPSHDAVASRDLAQVGAPHLRGPRGTRQVAAVRGHELLDPVALPLPDRALLRLLVAERFGGGGRAIRRPAKKRGA